MFVIILFFSSLILIIYGYVVRAYSIYFFWESRDIGWALLLLTIIVFLVKRIKFLKSVKRNRIAEKAIVVMICFILFVQSTLLISFSNHEAIKAVKDYIVNSEIITDQIGKLKSIYIVPLGSISTTKQDNGNSFGEIRLALVLKGEKGYKDVKFFLTKQSGFSKWNVVSPYW